MSEPRTFADLKAILDREPKGSWPSRVNAGMTHTQALDILSNGVAAMPQDALLEASTRGVLMKRNVLRECRSRKEDDGDET